MKETITALAILLFPLVALIGCGNEANLITNPTAPTIKTIQIFHLENATDHDIHTKLSAITLHIDGSAEFATPSISSYHLPECRYSYLDGELLIHAVIYPKTRERYNLEDGEIIARFSVVDENTLSFISATVPLFVETDMQFVRLPMC
jgi:hypothetical protein